MNLLLFIDFQKVFEKDGYWPIENYQKTLSTALRVKDKISNLKIITTQFIPPDLIKGKGWIEYYKDIPKEMCYKDYSGYKLSDNVPQENVLTANTFGKWNEIQKHYKNQFENVYIMGVSTDCCVLTTALSAVDSGAKVFVIEDACSAQNQINHDRAIAIMKGYGPNLTVINSSIF